MSEFIAFALDAMDLVDFFFDILVVGEELDQRASSGDEVVGHRREHGEESCCLLGMRAQTFGNDRVNKYLR